MTGAVHHHNLVRADHALARQLQQAGEGDGGCRFDRQPFHLGRQVHSLEGLFVCDALHRAPRAAQHSRSQQLVVAARISRAERGDIGAWVLDRGGLLFAALPGLNHRRTASRLDAGDRRTPVDQAHLLKLCEALQHAKRSESAADGLDIPIGGGKAAGGSDSSEGFRLGELLGHLEGNGLHRLYRCDAASTAIKIEAA